MFLRNTEERKYERRITLIKTKIYSEGIFSGGDIFLCKHLAKQIWKFNPIMISSERIKTDR